MYNCDVHNYKKLRTDMTMAYIRTAHKIPLSI